MVLRKILWCSLLSSGEVQEKMLEELQKIREAVEPKPASPPPPPKGFREEFMDFLNKYGIIDSEYHGVCVSWVGERP